MFPLLQLECERLNSLRLAAEAEVGSAEGIVISSISSALPASPDNSNNSEFNTVKKHTSDLQTEYVDKEKT